MIRLLLVVLLLGCASDLAAQRRGGGFSGVKVEGNLHFNRSTLDGLEVRQPENAYGLGVEFVGRQFGLGIYGYSVGRVNSFNSDTTNVVVVAEANYYLPIPELRIAPYVGVHAHMGTFDRGYFDDPFLPGPEDGLDDLGYQLGVRFKPFPLIGIDAQWRRQSDSAWEDQSGFLERNQVLVGVVLF